ncbi:MAG: efflux RND transporter periplasmic adaptor subunit [Verrucomicrobiota bacterium]
MKQRMFTMLLCAAVALACIGFAKFRQIQAAIAMGKSFAPPPSAVTTLRVTEQDWEPSIRVIGSLKAVQGVQVSTDLAGIVSEIAFESGKAVQKGDLLVQLNADQEHAQLGAAQARRDLAKIEASRKRDLVALKAAPLSDRDATEAELRKAEAACDEAAALLARKRISAPFDGVLGIRQVSLGQFLNPGAPIATMHSLDPIQVQFTLPQQQIAAAQAGRSIYVIVEELLGQPRTGTIVALDSQLDQTTRAITVEATLPNADHALRPGMFVYIELPLPKESNALVVPASAINYAPYGNSVYVIKDVEDSTGKPAKTAVQQFVKIGQNRGDQIRILSGLKDGDEVITSGVFKLRPGAPVQVNNQVQPSNEAAPHPPNS